MIIQKYQALIFLMILLTNNQEISQKCVCGHVRSKAECQQSGFCTWQNESCLLNYERTKIILDEKTNDDCKYFAEDECREQYECSFYLGFCVNFVDCNIFNKDHCQQSSYRCVSDGRRCVEKQKCSDYKTEIGCANQNKDGGYCLWVQEMKDKCRDIQKCEELPIYFTNHIMCQQGLDGCTVNDKGYGCINQKDQCIEYQNDFQCFQSRQNKNNCFWDNRNKKCFQKICENLPFSQDYECKSILSDCTTNGTHCILRKQCSDVQNKFGCITDIQGNKCVFHQNQSKIKRCDTASDTFTNYKQCQDYDNFLDCVTSENGGCKQRPNQCEGQVGQDDCKSIEQQNCIWFNNKCEKRGCQHAPDHYNKQDCLEYGNCIEKIGGGCQVKPNSCEEILQEQYCEFNFNQERCIWLNNRCTLLECNKLKLPNYQNHQMCQKASTFCTFNIEQFGCADYKCENISEIEYCRIDSIGTVCTINKGCIEKKCKTAPITYNTNQTCEEWLSYCTVNVQVLQNSNILIGCVNKQDKCEDALEQQCYSTFSGINCKWDNINNKCLYKLCTDADPNIYLNNQDCKSYQVLEGNCIIASSGQGCQVWPNNCDELISEIQCQLNLQDGTKCFWTGSVCKILECSDASIINYTNNIECNSWIDYCIYNSILGGCMNMEIYNKNIQYIYILQHIKIVKTFYQSVQQITLLVLVNLFLIIVIIYMNNNVQSQCINYLANGIQQMDYVKIYYVMKIQQLKQKLNVQILENLINVNQLFNLMVHQDLDVSQDHIIVKKLLILLNVNQLQHNRIIDVIFMIIIVELYFLIDVNLLKIVKAMRFVNFTIHPVFYNQVDKDVILLKIANICLVIFVIVQLLNTIISVIIKTIVVLMINVLIDTYQNFFVKARKPHMDKCVTFALIVLLLVIKVIVVLFVIILANYKLKKSIFHLIHLHHFQKRVKHAKTIHQIINMILIAIAVKQQLHAFNKLVNNKYVIIQLLINNVDIISPIILVNLEYADIQLIQIILYLQIKFVIIEYIIVFLIQLVVLIIQMIVQRQNQFNNVINFHVNGKLVNVQNILIAKLIQQLLQIMNASYLIHHIVDQIILKVKDTLFIIVVRFKTKQYVINQILLMDKIQKFCSDYTIESDCENSYGFQGKVVTKCFWCIHNTTKCSNNKYCSLSSLSSPQSHQDCQNENIEYTISFQTDYKCTIKKLNCEFYDYKEACVKNIDGLLCEWMSNLCVNKCQAVNIIPAVKQDCFNWHSNCMLDPLSKCKPLSCSLLLSYGDCNIYTEKCFWNNGSCYAIGTCNAYQNNIVCSNTSKNAQGIPCFWNNTQCEEKTCSNNPTAPSSHLDCSNWLPNCYYDINLHQCIEDCTTADNSYITHDLCQSYYHSKICTVKLDVIQCVDLPISCDLAQKTQCYKDRDGNQCYFQVSQIRCIVLTCSNLESDFTSHDKCNQKLQECTVNETLNGCQQLNNCSSYLIQEQCQIDQNNIQCEWIKTQNKCMMVVINVQFIVHRDVIFVLANNVRNVIRMDGNWLKVFVNQNVEMVMQEVMNYVMMEMIFHMMDVFNVLISVIRNVLLRIMYLM
ncbi:unnamed protein product [Paramecium pentaurelia]|uniref:Transmembrane protein n=1 Tax=Paramecium pentaurelia TaxID=43138 RepID=A0A8S1XX45_9CILI|nr:unnamed protein product [Paramecium pentaurelia]